MLINGKEYVFRDRVVIGQMLRVERLQKEVQDSLKKMAYAEGWRARYDEWKLLRRVGKLWMEMCRIIFQNVDKGLDFRNLTPQEVQAIPVNFFDSLKDKEKTLNEISSNSEEKVTP